MGRYTIDWRLGDTRYVITVSNPEHLGRGVRSVELDGAPVDAHAIPLVEDGQVHNVHVVLGKTRPAEAPSGAAHAVSRTLH